MMHHILTYHCKNIQIVNILVIPRYLLVRYTVEGIIDTAQPYV